MRSPTRTDGHRTGTGSPIGKSARIKDSIDRVRSISGMSDRSRRSPAANAADTMVREKPLEREESKYGSGKMKGEGDDRSKETEVANNDNKACTRRMVRAKTTRRQQNYELTRLHQQLEINITLKSRPESFP